MKSDLYIREQLNFINVKQQNLNVSHFSHYQFLRFKRFILLTIMIFAFEFLTTHNIKFLWPALPLYPSIGINYVLFYLFGPNAFLGLLLGEGLAYALNGFSPKLIIIYLIADLGFSSLASFLTHTLFSSDIKPFIKKKELIDFVLIIGIISLCSSALKFFGLKDSILDPTIFLFWLSDFNAICILSFFIFSWVYVAFSRETIIDSKLPYPTMYFVLTLNVLLLIFSLFFINNLNIFYIILVCMGISSYISYSFGYLLGSLFLFLTSLIYLGHCIALKQNDLAPFILFFYLMLSFFIKIKGKLS